MENTFGDILSDVAAGGDRRARPRRLGEPRRREPGHLRAGARLGARHRRHRRGEPDRDAALARAAARARARRARARALARGRGRRRAIADGADRPTSAATATTSEFGAAVLARARERGRRRDASSATRARRAATAPPRPRCSRLPAPATEPLASFIAVVEATVAAEVALGVLPIENSLHGPVAETHDLLYEAPLSIVSEVTLPIVHCLLAKDADPARRGADAALVPGRVRPVPRPDPLARRALHRLGDDRGRRARGGRVGRPDRGGDRERARRRRTSGCT